MTCTDVFRGRLFCVVGGGGGSGKGVQWEHLFMEEFITREENFHEEAAGTSSIIKKK